MDDTDLGLLDFENFQTSTAGSVPKEVNRWQRLEQMVEAEKDPLALFLLTPAEDLEEQVKYCDYLLWRYLAYEARLEAFIEEEEEKAAKFVNAYVAAKQSQIDPGTSKFYSHAYATRLANIERTPMEHSANVLSAQRKLKLVKAYIRALESKGRKLPGAQGTYNRKLVLEMGT